MHICFVAEHFHPPWIEGYQNILREIISSLGKEMEISVISLSMDIEHVNKWQGEKSDLDVYHIGVGKLDRLNGIMSAIKVLRLLQIMAKKEKIDVIHVHNVKKGLFSLLINRFVKKPVIVQVSKSLIPHNANLRLKTSACIDIRMMKCSGARAFVATSSSLKREMEDLGFNKYSIIHIPPAIDIDKFRPMNRKKLLLQNGFGVGYFFIGYLGRIAPGRGVMELLSAFKRLTNRDHNIRLILATTPNPSCEKYRQMLDEYVRGPKSSNYITCLGASNAVEKIYNMLDLVVVPLLDEAAVDPPLTLLEAMSCGKVVIASKIGDIPKIIKDGENGYLVSPGNVDELYEKMKFVVTHQKTLDKIGNNARKTILRQFSSRIMAKRHIELYSGLT
jgi:glycosyltransferase involved in cell wall biosynthesis